MVIYKEFEESWWQLKIHPLRAPLALVVAAKPLFFCVGPFPDDLMHEDRIITYGKICARYIYNLKEEK